MAHIVFYEKPGCLGNARQKAILRRAGHTLDVRDLLTAAWTAESLMAFLAALPVADWFNRSAPAIKRGEVVPETLGRAQALSLLLATPLLIRRPLMQWGEFRTVGFDLAFLQGPLGLGGVAPGTGSLEGCAAAAGEGTPASDPQGD